MPLESSAAIARLRAAWGGTLAFLLAATAPLWTPVRDVPRVAPFGAPPAFVEAALLIALGLGLLAVLFRGDSARRGVGITAIALVLLMAFDQLRWQPWAYHALLVGVVLATSPARRAIRLLRLVAIAVYAYSAIAKLDAEFVATLGQQMVGVLIRPIGVDVSSIPESVVSGMAISLPIGELLLAVLLAASLRWDRLTRPACLLVAAAHATTVAVLSPWGLGHSLGVLMWNAGFACQTIVLFGSGLPEANESPDGPPYAPIASMAVFALGVLVPLGAPFGLWDQWPGWALYAPGGERAKLFVHAAAADRLPSSMRPHLVTEAASPWQSVRVDDWVLHETGAPLYPQNRIVAALAMGLLERYPLTDRVRVFTESAAHRMTRKREGQDLTDPAGIGAAARLLGAKPTVVWHR